MYLQMVAHINVSFGSTDKSVLLLCAASGSGSAGFPVFLLGNFFLKALLGNLVGRGKGEGVRRAYRFLLFFFAHDRRWLALRNVGNGRVVGLPKLESR